MAERHKSKDTLGLYDAAQLYKLVRVRIVFASPERNDDGIYLALSSSNLFAVFTCFVSHRKPHRYLGRSIRGLSSYYSIRSSSELILVQYRLHILTLAGHLLASFTPDPDPGLGIRNAVWHPSGMFLAVGGWDDKARCTQ
jgi:hypothetical protein